MHCLWPTHWMPQVPRFFSACRRNYFSRTTFMHTSKRYIFYASLIPIQPNTSAVMEVDVCVHVMYWRACSRRVFVLRSNLEEVGEVFAAGHVRWQVDERVAVFRQGDLTVFYWFCAGYPPWCWGHKYKLSSGDQKDVVWCFCQYSNCSNNFFYKYYFVNCANCKVMVWKCLISGT